jgi:hypothetical protein
MQIILVIATVLISLIYLGNKFGLWNFGKSKNKKGCEGCALAKAVTQED